MEFVGRMMDELISYDPRARLEAVLSGATVKHGDKIERLEEVAIFNECSQRQLRSIARIARVFDATAGAMLIRAGEPGDEFFLILEGTASVDVATKKRGALLPGAFFGEMSLLDGDTGPPPRDQSPGLLCAFQGRARAHPVPLDDALTTRPAGRRECGTCGGRVGWVIRRGRHPAAHPQGPTQHAPYLEPIRSLGPL